MNKAIFFDMDGSLIPDILVNTNQEMITLEPGVVEGLAMLKKQQYLLIVISNQPGIALGEIKESDMIQVQKKILQLLKPWHVSLNGFYYCPHHPQGKFLEYSSNCFCRKPQPGLLLRAARDFNINLSISWMIGNILQDMEAGKRAGCKTIMVNNGKESAWEMNEFSMPDFEFGSFSEAAEFIARGIDQVPINRPREQRRASI